MQARGGWQRSSPSLKTLLTGDEASTEPQGRLGAAWSRHGLRAVRAHPGTHPGCGAQLCAGNGYQKAVATGLNRAQPKQACVHELLSSHCQGQAWREEPDVPRAEVDAAKKANDRALKE